MPINRNAYLRYLTIHREIRRNRYKPGYPTKVDLLRSLAEETDCSESTLEKDIFFLKTLGAPIVYDRDPGQRCYRYTDEWEFDVQLSPEDIRMLRMLIHKLEIFGEAPEFRMVRDSIDTISSHFSLSQRHPDDRIDKYILFEYSKGFAGKHLLPLIYDAIYEKREIAFTHCRYDSEEPTQRRLQPYILKEHRNRWYVIGKEDEEPRIFGIDRICSLEVSERYFIQEPEFYDEVFRILYDSVGVMAFGYKSENVVLRFSPAEAKYIKSLMLHRSQEIISDDENGLTVKLHVKVTKEFIMECILRFGDDVIVVEPPGLAAEIVSIYDNALRRYKTAR